MAEIVHFPRPAPRLVWSPAETDSFAFLEANADGRENVAKALEHLSSAGLELACINLLSLRDDGDVTERVSEEVLTGICHALIAVIDARGCRNDDRALRNAAARTIADREGMSHGN
ncbi:hypothetical protein [Rhizobium leguminosarum]|uniref:hypothetical protein n=1 Tax=Rhizobium leguminosarum TaxID=384 RepID=UPI001C90BEC4|nr:hypothetical protein [Rhizobium leguminosarum]MBY2911389.1 hypothetical protein [Rhizobium leguminosarum]